MLCLLGLALAALVAPADTELSVARACGLGSLRGAKSLTVAVLGGSMTAGTGCKTATETGRACAWPAQMEKHLAAALGANVTVLNMAVAASSTPGHAATALGQLKMLGAALDAVIVDYSVNDYALASGEKREGRGYPGADGTGGGLAEATEALVRNLLCLPSAPAVLYFDTKPVEPHNAIAAMYGIPQIGGKKALFSGKHPHSDLHRSFGNGVGAALLAAGAAAAPPPGACASATCATLPAPLGRESLLEAYSPCGSGGVLREVPELQPADSQGWSLFEDVPGKLGWIANSTNSTADAPPAFMSFDVTLGARGVVSVTYQQSWRRLGVAVMWLGDPTPPLRDAGHLLRTASSEDTVERASVAVLHGWWETAATMTSTEVWDPNTYFDKHKRAKVRHSPPRYPPGAYRLHIAMWPHSEPPYHRGKQKQALQEFVEGWNMFKVTAVGSC